MTAVFVAAAAGVLELSVENLLGALAHGGDPGQWHQWPG